MKHYRSETNNQGLQMDFGDYSLTNEISQDIFDENLLNIEESSDLLNNVEENLDFKSPIYRSDLLNNVEENLDFKSPIWPVTHYGPPTRGDFSGIYNFEASLSGETTNRKKYLYSAKLNRVYMCMMTEMPVQFQWNWNALKDRKLWVRATPILARVEDQEARVLRCSIHKELNDVSNKDVPPSLIPHVLRSARQGPDVVYCGTEQDNQSWLSVAFEPPSHPSDGATAFQHVYMFCCKHSCISGINRRPVEILFTLEDDSGQIIGRHSLGVRVCSCPRRDMEKDEAECRVQPATKKRRLSHSNVQAANNTDTYVIHSLYNLCMAADRQLPPGNPAIVQIRTLAEELHRQIQESK